MKQGRTLQELAQVITDQNAAKRDFVAATGVVSFVDHDGRLQLAMNSHGTYEPTKIFHQQVGQTLGIPGQFYDRLLKNHPDLLMNNVNALFQREPKKRMIRTMQGNARAFLSDSFRPLDNFDLMSAVLPKMQEQELEIMSCEVTESRLYIKGVSHRIQADVRNVGDIVEAGIMISNSEVGMGAVKVDPFINRLVCTNGMIVNKLAQRRTHVGRKIDIGVEEAAYEFITDDTRKLEDSAFWHKVQDIVGGMLNEAKFRDLVTDFEVAAGRPITGAPDKVVEVTSKRFQLTEGERGDVMRHLINGGALTQWGLANAVTRTAEDAKDYDRATELERIGGDIVVLEPENWSVISSVK